jgi:hypothetical protein
MSLAWSRPANDAAYRGQDEACLITSKAEHVEGSVVHMTSTGTAVALFASILQASEHATAEQVTAAVRDSLRRHGGQQGCASVCAAEYGEHPDTAPARMRWALALANHASAAAAIAA